MGRGLVKRLMQPGDLYDLYVPFEDKPGGKYRPALIMTTDGTTAIAVTIKVTSTPPNPRFPHRIPIRNWRLAGLNNMSYAQYDYFQQVNMNGTYRRRGALLPSDFTPILNAFITYHMS